MTEYICAEGPCLSKPFTTNDRTKIEGHIASKHLNYFPYVCGICHDQGIELAAPTLNNFLTHTRKFHPDQAQKTKVCLDDDKEEELEEWIERTKHHSATSTESSEIQVSITTSSSIGNSAHGQHCETPSDTTVNEIPFQPSPKDHLLATQGQFPTSYALQTDNVVFPPEIGGIFLPGNFCVPENIAFAGNALLSPQNFATTETANFQPENGQQVENSGTPVEAVVPIAPPMQFEEQNVTHLPDGSILGRFLKQEQISNPEPVEIVSDSPGFIISDPLNTSQSSFSEFTSTPKPPETKLKAISTKSSNRRCRSKLSVSKNKNRVTCQLCRQSIKPSYKHAHITVSHLDVPYYYCIYCKHEVRTKSSLDFHLRSKHAPSVQKVGTKKEMDGQIAQFMKQCFDDVQTGRHEEKEEEEEEGHSAAEPEASPIEIYCKLCGEYIPSNSAETHIIPLHMNDNKVFCCNNCNDLFGSIIRFVDHHPKVHKSKPLDLKQKTTTYDEIYQACFATNAVEHQEKSIETSQKHISSDTIDCGICKKVIYKEAQRAHVISSHLTGHFNYDCSYCSYSFADSNKVWKHQLERHPSEKRKAKRNKAYEDEILKQMAICFESQPHQSKETMVTKVKVEPLDEHQVSETVAKPVTITISETSVQPITISELVKKSGKQLSGSKISEEQSDIQPVSESSSTGMLVQSSSLSGSSRKRVLSVSSEQPIIVIKAPKRVSDVYALRRSDSATSRCHLQNKSSEQLVVQQSSRNASDLSIQPAAEAGSDIKDEPTVSESSEQAVDAFESAIEESDISEQTGGFITVPIFDVMECRICKKHVRKNVLKPHVIAHHLSGNYYHCGYCTFSANDAGTVAYHQKKKHYKNRRVQRNKEFADEIATQMTDCFDGQPLIKREVTTSVPSPTPTLSQPCRRSAESVVPTMLTKLVNDSKECHECKQIVRIGFLKDHIVGHHLSEPYFNCDLCTYTSNWQSSFYYHRMKKHYKYGKKVNSKMEKEISEMMEKCFDNQPMVEREVTTYVSTPNPLQPRRLSLQSNVPVTETKIFNDLKRCRECKQTVHIKSLKSHVVGHHMSEPYFCHLCKFTSKFKNVITGHFTKEHKGQRQKVNINVEKEITEKMKKCFDGQPVIGRKVTIPPLQPSYSLKRQFSFPETFDDNGDKKSDDRIKCLKCGKKVKDAPQSQKAHIMAYHVEGDCFMCGHCSFTARWYSAIARHTLEKHPSLKSITKSREAQLSPTIGEMMQKCFKKKKFNYKCEECNYIAESSRLLKVHKFNHKRSQRLSPFDQGTPNAQVILPGSGPTNIITPKTEQLDSTKLVVCRICDCGILGNARQGHIASHHLEENLYACPCCDYSSAYYSGCLGHIKMHHNGIEKPKNLIKTDLELALKVQALQLECFGGKTKSVSSASKQKIPSRMKALLSQMGNSETITCLMCKESLPSKASFHIYKHLDKKYFGCSYCNFESRFQSSVYSHVKAKHPTLSTKVVTAPGLQEAIERKLQECFEVDIQDAQLEEDSTNDNTCAAITMDYCLDSSDDNVKYTENDKTGAEITMEYKMNSSSDFMKSPEPMATPVVFLCKKCNQSTSKCEEHAWGHLDPTPDHLPCRCTFPECRYEGLSETAVAEHGANQHNIEMQAVQYFIHTENYMLDMVKEIVSQCFD